MKVQLLPSSIDENGCASQRQHLLSIIIDDRVAIDAGCLAFSCTDVQREQVRDIILTHPHLDHIAALPMYIDDLFAMLKEPIRIHATRESIDILERDIFNWAVYPRFSELKNDFGAVIEYHEFSQGTVFEAAHLSVRSVPVNHQVGSNGYFISDRTASIAITGDTAETDEIWRECGSSANLKAMMVECAFPDELDDLAEASFHLTPKRLRAELEKIGERRFPVYVINLKPMYRDEVIEQLKAEEIPNLEILEVGKVYEF
ncbi:MAG: 3',5'-cyclic-nucleotide phosphodiesterase [Saprospiraceae bacterium]|nr:3',5'-cyclic-nucleotide phosphodiesterase [Pyrinomonadaceae bacterium]